MPRLLWCMHRSISRCCCCSRFSLRRRRRKLCKKHQNIKKSSKEETNFVWCKIRHFIGSLCIHLIQLHVSRGGGKKYSIEVKHEFLHFPHFYIVDEKEEDISSYHTQKEDEGEWTVNISYAAWKWMCWQRNSVRDNPKITPPQPPQPMTKKKFI